MLGIRPGQSRQPVRTLHGDTAGGLGSGEGGSCPAAGVGHVRRHPHPLLGRERVSVRDLHAVCQSTEHAVPVCRVEPRWPSPFHSAAQTEPTAQSQAAWAP